MRVYRQTARSTSPPVDVCKWPCRWWILRQDKCYAPGMQQPIKGTRIAVLIENTYQDLELWYPTLRLRAAGAEVQIVGESAGKAYTGSHGYPAQAQVGANDIRADEFDGIVIPGGYAPDKMRRNGAMVDLVRTF